MLTDVNGRVDLGAVKRECYVHLGHALTLVQPSTHTRTR